MMTRQTHPWRNQEGFTLVQSLVGMAVGLLVVMYTAQFFKAGQGSMALLKQKDILTEIEENVRFAAADQASMNKSMTVNDKLRSCIKEDGAKCPQKAQEFNLWYGSKLQLTGKFNLNGEKCSAGLTGCPFEVVTQFSPACPDAACDPPSLIFVRYSIMVEGALFRTGQIPFVLKNSMTSDDNNSCGVAANGAPRFANAIVGATLTCVTLPGISRQVEGVVPGDCDRTKEVLVGFDATTGEKICEPFKF